MLDVYIDADACPVKAEILRVSQRYALGVYIVSNSGLRPVNDPNIHMIQVAAGADVADDWIAERCGDGDIVVTADILLAGRCLNNKSHVISPSGKPFTDSNIGSAIAGRSLSAHLRELDSTSGHNPSFTRQDRSRFLQALDEAIQTIKRRK